MAEEPALDCAGEESIDHTAFVGFDVMRQDGTFVSEIGPFWRRRDPGIATIYLDAERRHCNPNGIVHGGVLMTLMDLALGTCIESALDLVPDRSNHSVTIQMSVNMVSSARPGDRLVATASIERVGRKVAFSRGEIRVGDRIVMSGSGVFRVPEPG